MLASQFLARRPDFRSPCPDLTSRTLWTHNTAISSVRQRAGGHLQSSKGARPIRLHYTTHHIPKHASQRSILHEIWYSLNNLRAHSLHHPYRLERHPLFAMMRKAGALLATALWLSTGVMGFKPDKPASEYFVRSLPGMPPGVPLEKMHAG